MATKKTQTAPTQEVQTTPVKKPRAPRKPKTPVEVTTVETPVKKPRAPRKPKVETPIVEVKPIAPISPSKEEVESSVDKMISGLKKEETPKKNYLKEIAIAALCLMAAYGLGALINSERSFPVENNTTIESSTK